MEDLLGVVYFIGICLAIIYFLKKRKIKKLVLKNSKNINMLFKINQKYSFYQLKTSHFDIYYCANSKRTFEKLTYFDVLNKYIENNINNLRLVIENTINNREIYNKYLIEISGLRYTMDNNFFYNHKIKSSDFYNIERQLFQKNKIKDTFYINVTVHIYYTTPTGRNTYSKQIQVNYNNIVSLYNNWKQKYDKKKVVDEIDFASSFAKEECNYNNISLQSGRYYDENSLIFDKYRNLKTPNYIIVQINEKLHPTKKIFISDEMIELSNKFKDKYLDYADFFPFSSYWAKISDLNEYQLKWYLYWRKEFLNNNVLDTDISYIFIFAYELISYTFNISAAFNISVLDRLYNSYKNLFPNLSNYLPQWLDDMLSEVGYYYNLSDTSINNIEEDLLVNSLTTTNELDKININIWRKHYNEIRSDLTNRQLSLLSGNQKFNNRLKKYSGLLAKYYIDNNVDIIEKWFEVKVVIEKRKLFNGVPCSLQRMEGTFKYKKYFSNSSFEHDMNQITKLCYDLIYPQNDMNENDYVISQYEDGKYELPEDFFYMIFEKKDKNTNRIINSVDPIIKKEFSIDISKISNDATKIDFIDNSQEKINFDKEEQDFINLFDNKILDKKNAQQYCIKKGKMLNAYINNLNEKYFSILQKELIIIDDDKLRLNIEKEENAND